MGEIDMTPVTDILEAENPELAKVTPFPDEAVHRITAERVIRQALSHIDLLESAVLIYRLQGKGPLMMHYSSEVGAIDLLVGGTTMVELAKARMGINQAPDNTPNPNPNGAS